MESDQDIVVSCFIKRLPDHDIIPAARAAVLEDPRNEPPIAQFAMVADNDESDRILTPMYIAAMTTKYFGPATRVLPVYFMDNPDQSTRTTILKYANIWDCGITYKETANQGDSRVRIARGNQGHFSYLGTDIYMIPFNQITMNLQGFTSQTNPSELMRVIPHEFAHNMGCPHEHARADILALLKREETIQHYMRQQGWSRQQVISQIFTPMEESSLMGTPANVDSIMCYRFEGFLTINGQPILGGSQPTADDLAFMRKIYPKTDGDGSTPAPVPPNPPVVVQPPDPTPPTPVLPDISDYHVIKYRRWTKTYQYTQTNGPIKFIYMSETARPFGVQIQGPGAWVVDVTPLDPNAAPVEVRPMSSDPPIMLAAATTSDSIISVRPKAAHRSAKFRIRIV